MRIGLISDTHGTIPQPAFEILKGVDRIVHAGDIGDHSDGRDEVLAALEAIAPVTAISGNMDGFMNSGIEMWKEIDTPNGRLGVTHRAVESHRVLREVGIECANRGVRWLIFGHTHTPERLPSNGTVYINPGSASSGRNGSPRSLAILTLGDGGTEELVFYDLDVGAPYRPLDI